MGGEVKVCQSPAGASGITGDTGAYRSNGCHRWEDAPTIT